MTGHVIGSSPEEISWQLKMLAYTIGNAYHDTNLSEDDYLAMMTWLYEIAYKVFPEGKPVKDAA